MTKLKAFTLIELILAMLLTGVLLTFIGASIIVFDKQLKKLRAKNDTIITLNSLGTVLSTDIDKAEAIFSDGQKEFTLLLKDQYINYYFAPNNVYRRVTGHVDTFVVRPTDLFYTDTLGLVSSISLTLEKNEYSVDLFLFKTYCTSDIIKQLSNEWDKH